MPYLLGTTLPMNCRGRDYSRIPLYLYKYVVVVVVVVVSRGQLDELKKLMECLVLSVNVDECRSWSGVRRLYSYTRPVEFIFQNRIAPSSLYYSALRVDWTVDWTVGAACTFPKASGEDRMPIERERKRHKERFSWLNPSTTTTVE